MQNENENNCKDAKVVIIGETGVGKTSIIKQYMTHIFDENCVSSISSQFCSKIVEIPGEDKSIRFDVWDTAGQEKYRSLAKIFYKDAHIIIFVYDITNRETLEGLQQYWYPEIQANCTTKAVMAVVANKFDLYNCEGAVEDKEGIEWADKIGAIFQITSAKSSLGINKLFENVGKKLLNPKYNCKKEDHNDKLSYEIKKNEKQNKNKKGDEDEECSNEIPDIKNVKLSKDKHKTKKKTKKCC